MNGMTKQSAVAPATSGPSRLWAHACASAPFGQPWPRADRCVMCGDAIAAGELAVPVTTDLFDAAFNNKIDCKAPGGAVCGFCMCLWDKRWLQSVSKAVAVHGHGVFWLRAKPDIAAFILHGPAAPYVAIWNTRQQAHMIWRTPVSEPANWISVRLDDDIAVIDRRRTMDGVRAWQLACGILARLGKPKAQPAMLSWDLAATTAGMLIPKNAQAVQEHSSDGSHAIEVLRSLTVWDWWALCAMRDFDMDAPRTWPQLQPVAGEAPQDEEASPDA